MTATSSRELPSREARVPWMLRPRAIVVANVICFAANILTAVSQSGRDQLTNICARFDNPTNYVVGMTVPATVAVVFVFVVAGLGIVLTAIWRVRTRASNRRPGSPTRTAILLIGFALLNMLLAYFFGLSALWTHVSCPGGV